MITTEILRQGWDGKKCLVHARMAVHGQERLITAQYLDVTGSDLFDALLVSYAPDGVFAGFSPDPVFAETFTGPYKNVCCDMTPTYHKATDCFFVTGAAASYTKDAFAPVAPEEVRTRVPYAVFDRARACFSPVRWIDLPEKYYYANSGCSQLCEAEDGTLFMPISFREKKNGALEDKAGVAVVHLAFDGTEMRVLSVSDDIRCDSEPRGIGEGSVVLRGGELLLTIRGDNYGFVSRSRDGGKTFSAPQVWRWKDGFLLPTYCTQSHWMEKGNELYLVYTRKGVNNNHVFRHRAPLLAARVDGETLTVDPATEFVCVPERGARLGNFGVCRDGDTAYVCASEWMQFEGCEKHGSNNALFVTTVR